jgi:hypothetical protein
LGSPQSEFLLAAGTHQKKCPHETILEMTLFRCR